MDIRTLIRCISTNFILFSTLHSKAYVVKMERVKERLESKI